MPGIPIPPTFNTERDGIALESISDEIDKINVLKDQARKEMNQVTAEEENIYEQSKFDSEKDKSQFRQYEEAKPEVKKFYLEQHTKQTVAYNLKARNEFRSKTRAEMTIWEAMEKLNTLIDESDPDTSLTQIEHLLQAAEAMRKDGKPRWMQLASFSTSSTPRVSGTLLATPSPWVAPLTTPSSTATSPLRTMQIMTMKSTAPRTASTPLAVDSTMSC